MQRSHEEKTQRRGNNIERRIKFINSTRGYLSTGKRVIGAVGLSGHFRSLAARSYRVLVRYCTSHRRISAKTPESSPERASTNLLRCLGG